MPKQATVVWFLSGAFLSSVPTDLQQQEPENYLIPP